MIMLNIQPSLGSSRLRLLVRGYVWRQRRSIHRESAAGRIRRGEPGAAPQDSVDAQTPALKERFTFDANWTND